MASRSRFCPLSPRLPPKLCANSRIFNASIDGKNIVYYREINIGIAVALEGGLIVPVIRNADERTSPVCSALSSIWPPAPVRAS